MKELYHDDQVWVLKSEHEEKLSEVRAQLRIEINGHEDTQQEIKDLEKENYNIRCEKQSWINKIEEYEYNEKNLHSKIKQLESKLGVAVQALDDITNVNEITDLTFEPLEMLSHSQLVKCLAYDIQTAYDALKEIKGE